MYYDVPDFTIFLWAFLAALPLALWKVIDIIIWVCAHVSISW